MTTKREKTSTTESGLVTKRLKGKGASFSGGLAVCAVLATLAACDSPDGPVEQAGETVDEAYEESTDKLDNVADELSDGAEGVKDDAEDALEKAGDNVEELADEAENSVDSVRS